MREKDARQMLASERTRSHRNVRPCAFLRAKNNNMAGRSERGSHTKHGVSFNLLKV